MCIDDSGHLSINYLGTKPPVNSVMTQVRELNYDLVEAEHKALLQIIRDSQSESKADVVDKLYIRVQYSKSLDMDAQETINFGQNDTMTMPLLPTDKFASLMSSSASSSLSNSSGGPYVKLLVRLYLSYSGDKAARNVSLVINAPEQIYVVPKSIILQSVGNVKSTPLMVKVYLYALKTQLPTSLEGTVTASYLSSNNEHKVTSIGLVLPMHISFKPKAPIKSASCKVILDTDKHSAQPLIELFGDFLYAYQQSGFEVSEIVGSNATHAMGFQLLAPVVNIIDTITPINSTQPDLSNGSSSSSSSSSSTISNTITNTIISSSSSSSNTSNVVSILVSKQAGRYRIQGDSYASLYLIVEELEHRLNMKLMNNDINSHRYITSSSTTTSTSAAANSSNNNSIVKCTDALPLDHYFSIITAHFNTRLQLNQLMSRLNDLAHQYRMLEKRLLVRYKDRNPTALNGLDILIRETYSKIIRLSETIAKLIIIAIIPSINHFHHRHHLYRCISYCSHPYHITITDHDVMIMTLFILPLSLLQAIRSSRRNRPFAPSISSCSVCPSC